MHVEIKQETVNMKASFDFVSKTKWDYGDFYNINVNYFIDVNFRNFNHYQYWQRGHYFFYQVI